jgi:hypothetical protein
MASWESVFETKVLSASPTARKPPSTPHETELLHIFRYRQSLCYFSDETVRQ